MHFTWVVTNTSCYLVLKKHCQPSLDGGPPLSVMHQCVSFLVAVFVFLPNDLVSVPAHLRQFLLRKHRLVTEGERSTANLVLHIEPLFLFQSFHSPILPFVFLLPLSFALPGSCLAFFLPTSYCSLSTYQINFLSSFVTLFPLPHSLPLSPSWSLTAGVLASIRKEEGYCLLVFPQVQEVFWKGG